MELIDKVVGVANGLFSRFGVRSVSMDDVARENAISKKTLYKCFRDKDDLVMKTLETHMNTMDSEIKSIFEAEPNPVKQIASIIDFVISRNRDMNPSLIYDLKKYHGECYNMFVQHRDTHIISSVQQNMNRGVEMGYYRQNLDVQIASRFYVYLVTNIFNPIEFPMGNNNYEQIFRELVRYHLHGICNDKGQKEIKKIEWLN